MNREIKFRAWDTETMLYQDTENCSVFEVLEDGELCIGSETDSTYEGCPFSVVKGSALMQYTGLKDKNGKDIYEGDILESDIEETTISVVWDDTGAGWHYDEHNIEFDDGVGRGDWRFTLGVAKNCYIIGNIYENPNLINLTTNEK